MDFKDLNYVSNKDFYLQSKDLTSLNGCPEVVKGVFNCMNNHLKSLKDSFSKYQPPNNRTARKSINSPASDKLLSISLP